ncbi:hypothetical protein NDU88_002591 [Pleurodeles waltl]|uniref:Uncharacterized protein n=1 Tax=Pleurodeles waltl TaxID=8319 RepID=A0AAV7VZS3_PLEWA|nr:hypothetical protein NDU88_002591 [Pleurodeles waltl]
MKGCRAVIGHGGLGASGWYKRPECKEPREAVKVLVASAKRGGPGGSAGHAAWRRPHSPPSESAIQQPGDPGTKERPKRSQEHERHGEIDRADWLSQRGRRGCSPLRKKRGTALRAGGCRRRNKGPTDHYQILSPVGAAECSRTRTANQGMPEPHQRHEIF